MKNQDQDPSKNGNRLWKGAAAGVLAATALVGCSSEAAPRPATTITVTETAEATAVHENGIDTEANRDAAIGVAGSVIDILGNPTSTTTVEYRGNMVGNKDAARPAEVPEAFIGFGQDEQTLYVSAVNGYDVRTGESTAGFDEPSGEQAFTSISMSMKVSRDNPIYGIPRQLTLDDFRNALAQPDTLQLTSLEGQWYEGHNTNVPNLRAYRVEVGADGSVSVWVDEDNKTSGLRPSGLEPSIDDQELVDRALQIAGASAQSFEQDMRR